MASIWHWKPIRYGLLRAAAVLIVGMMITGILVWRLSGPVYFFSPWIMFLLGAAALAGGYRAARLAKRRGGLQGLSVGALLALFCMFFWSVTGSYSLVTAGLDALSLMALGGVGGMLGAFSIERGRTIRAGR
ncbi:TIGR04086 family membrane protein [Heliobacterium gestii]|uniref:TIGR04086 family membrane protein n=1 Tax=Heliomicrobium gestii TaxID=2699 RepID=A0A845LHA7_HELGE|nr:TIGR04086 family membrane protein [Heliomicrobium gestii]MBM7866817.1 putative membrane protein (TIGR04086 family) [Heliomicrobium gestii]MZP42246.1 TIGR04086 family membrane protein [Heliomicrobium gestii]